MKEFKVKVEVLLRPDLLDPQGQAVEQALKDLEVNSISDTRVGKLIIFYLKDNSYPEAKKRVEYIADTLLANPVIEDFTYSIQEDRG